MHLPPNPAKNGKGPDYKMRLRQEKILRIIVISCTYVLMRKLLALGLATVPRTGLASEFVHGGIGVHWVWRMEVVV